MNRVDTVRNLVNECLVNTQKTIDDKTLTDIKMEIDRITKIANDSNKNKLLRLSNFEFFRLYAMLANYEIPYYADLEDILREHASIIDSWTYDNEGRILYEIVSKKLGREMDTPDYLELLEKLGISEELSDYYLTMPLHAIYSFMRFKEEVRSLIAKIGYIVDNPTRKGIEHFAYDHCGVSRLINAANDFIKDELKTKKEHDDAMHKRIKYCKELLELIDDGDLEKLLLVPDYWHKYLDFKILEELYDIVNQNMLKEYLKLQEEEKEILDSMGNSELKKYLFSKQLDYDTLDKDRRDVLEQIPNIIDRIKYFESLGLDIVLILTTYYDCLINYNEEKVKFLESLVKVNAIKRSTLKDNLEVLLGEKYEIIKLNYQILKDIIDFNNMFYKDSLLFMDSHKLRNIISILKEYNLSKNNYMFLLCNFMYINIYDLMLEHSISLELLSSICHTSNPIDTIKRIIVYKSIGEDYESSNHRLKKDVISNSKFDDELDVYLDNIIPMLGINNINGNKIDNVINNPKIVELDSKYRIGDVYIINGTRVSRAKFLRNYQKSNNLVGSMISDSIMSSLEYSSLYNELNSKMLLTK